MDWVGRLKCFRKGSCVRPNSSLVTCMQQKYNWLIRLVILGSANRGFPPTRPARETCLIVIEFMLRVFRTEWSVRRPA